MFKKRFLLLSILFCTLYFNSGAQHHTDKPSTHGMLLMGSEKIYASHLPMFHSPHDYQVLVTLIFDENSRKKYIDDRKAHPEELIYTIEPEVFVLPEMINHTRKFQASVYRGHFERGGMVIAKDVTVTIEQVIYFGQFKTGATKPCNLQYFLFGNDKEQFLVHVINAKPDFDEVIKVQQKTFNPKIFENSPFRILEFKEADKRSGLSWKTNRSQILQDHTNIEFETHQQLYIEFGDLN
ncbi:hypothetical protein WSM22_24250 [Cytophagales bacterium WSM2-2]|nr:hypothetical protein WSM22_24250 [Cytophagales bacterium WSM2-2]